MKNSELFPPDILEAAESALDKLLCNDVQSCGGTDALRAAAIKDIADAIMADRQRWFTAIDEHKEEIERLRKALHKISSPSQTESLLWWQTEARQALAGGAA